MNAVLKSNIQNTITNYILKSGQRLSALQDENWQALLSDAKTIKLSRKSSLYEEGDVLTGIYILTKGRIKILSKQTKQDAQIVFICGVGETFGHRSLFGAPQQIATAIAMEDCELLFIEKEAFLATVRKSSHLSEIILEAISQDLAIMTNRSQAFAQKGIRERLALFLLILNETFRLPNQCEEASNILMNRNDLASYTGTSVENLVRTLKVFREQGYIKTEGKSLFIVNFEAIFDLIKN